jgi:membrane protein implicated in regulation of membrane protease activity
MQGVGARRSSASRTLGRYLLFQLPGWAVAGIVATLAAESGLVPPAVAWGGFGLWIAKDAALFPFVRRAYARDGPTHGHVGELGVAEGAIDDEGWVRIGPELWRARLRAGVQPIGDGTKVRVVAVDGLTLVIEAAPSA